MKKHLGIKSYKTVREALSSISKECKTYHEEILEKIVKGNNDLIKGVTSGSVQKGTR